MEVILLKEVANLGGAGEVKQVADGYAQNYLLPRKLVERATPEKKKALAQKQEAMKQENAQERAAMLTALESLSGDPLTITMPANEQGHLYKQLTADHISEAIQEKQQVNVPASYISMAAIKEVGEHVITVEHPDKKVPLTLNVQAA